MDFAFSEEQQMLRSAARDYLGDAYPLDRVVSLAESEAGWDPSSWSTVADLGWLGLSVPEDLGGAGMSTLDEAVVFEELGRSLYPGPYLSTVALALPLLAAAADREPSALADVVEGRRSATVAYAEPGGPVTLADAGRVRCSAAQSSSGWTLTGTKRFVTDGAIADSLLVVARDGSGVGVWLVDLREHRSVVTPLTTMDVTRRLADVTLAGTPARLLLDPAAAGPVLEQARLRLLAALSCEAVGIAQAALDLSSTYAGQRQQFGRVIGTYQGVSHRISNIYVALELARSLAYWAAWTVSVGDAAAAQACAAAKAAAGEAAVFACENAIQSMGGIGFTWDSPMHRYYKRAQAIDAMEGHAGSHRADIAAVLLDTPERLLDQAVLA